MEELHFNADITGERIDKFLDGRIESLSRSYIQKLIKEKKILVNQLPVKANYKLTTGDTILLQIPDPEPLDIQPENIPLDILYEDEQVMLINKPAGMLSQKAEKGDISMVEHLISHLLDTGEVTEEMLKTFRPSLCNRLDRNTSGIVAAGKTLQGLQMLSGLFKERTLHKYYLCIVKGVIKEEQDVRGWLLKNEKTNQVRIFKNETKDARPIHTKYRPLADNGQETLLEIELLTGRTHQIRAHLSYMGHPIFGDPKYGDAVLNKKLTSGYGLHMQLLHAWHLVFPELSGDFEGLSGKSIYAPAPKQFVSIAQKRGLGTWEHGIPEV